MRRVGAGAVKAQWEGQNSEGGLTAAGEGHLPARVSDPRREWAPSWSAALVGSYECLSSWKRGRHTWPHLVPPVVGAALPEPSPCLGWTRFRTLAAAPGRRDDSDASQSRPAVECSPGRPGPNPEAGS